MKLSSLIETSDLVNVSIVGHNNPTVNCTNTGGIHVASCRNCIIQGIVWNRCGSASKPAITLNSCSNTIIENCSFQYSQGQVLVLSEASSDVNINYCSFLHNNHYTGHGMAIHYLSNNETEISFAISHCNFTYNKGAKSLVHIESRISKPNNNQLVVDWCRFCHNEGSSIHAVKSNIYIYGKNLFQGNAKASYGAGIYIENESAFVFGDNSETTFIHNSAEIGGGAIRCYNYSHLSFEGNASILFSNNNASYFGGAIYSTLNVNITFEGNTSTVFIHNTAGHYNGGAIYKSYNSVISFKGNACTMFSHNTAGNRGGAIYLSDSHIYFEENSSTVFSNNSAEHYGGAVYSAYNSRIYIAGNVSAVFTSNTARLHGGALYLARYRSIIYFEGDAYTVFSNNVGSVGGAIYCYNQCYISFKRKASTLFSNNLAASGGAAIYSNGNSNISFEDNASTVFSNNNVDRSSGGTVYTTSGTSIWFKGNSYTEFSSNNATNRGGAVVSNSGNIAFEGSSSTLFSNNYASLNGGAMYLNSTNVSVEGNSTTVFSNNTANSKGGAIHFSTSNHIYFKGNSSTTFRNNIAHLEGGAIYLYMDSYLYFKESSSTLFNNNNADLKGGAMYFDGNNQISFKGNSYTSFKNNYVELSGGAIHSYNNVISFEADSFITFFGNVAKQYGGGMCLNNGIITFTGGSSTIFNDNNATLYGGDIYSQDIFISFKANSTAEFNNNVANNRGGAMYSLHCNISFNEYSFTTFRNNSASYGGALSTDDNSIVNFLSYSAVNFTDNKATFDTAIYSTGSSKIAVTGHSAVRFNHILIQLCNDECFPYSGEDEGFAIENSGEVRCNDQKLVLCISTYCVCSKFEHLITVNSLKSYSTLYAKNDMTLSSTVELFGVKNISLIGHDITVSCEGGRLFLISCSNVKIEGITWNQCGNYGSSNFDNAVIFIHLSHHVIIQNCNFQYSLGPVIKISSLRYELSINHCNFTNNNIYLQHGVAVQYSHDSRSWKSSTERMPIVNVRNCIFDSNGAAKSILYFEQESNSFMHIYLSNSKFYNNQGASVYLPSDKYVLHIDGDVLFRSNTAENGAAIYISEGSYIIFHENTEAKFINNFVNHDGAAIFQNHHSSVIFEQNSKVTFTNNKAINGTIYSKTNSNVIFKAACQVAFDGNSAAQYGSAIYSFNNSNVTFTGNSLVTFQSNSVVSASDANSQLGGAIFSGNNGYLCFEENSFTLFSNNNADFGAAILSLDNSNITFKDQSKVMFNNNVANICGALTSALDFIISFSDNAVVTFNANSVSYKNIKFSAGAMCISQTADIIFSGHSLVTFINNNAGGSGAMILLEGNFTAESYSTIIFKNNNAEYLSGGAFTCINNSNVTFKDNSNVTFNNNKASIGGGAVNLHNIYKFVFKDNSTSYFINNNARINGGALVCSQLFEFTIEGNSTVAFDYNTANNGGVFYFINSTLMFKEASRVSFNNNIVRQSGGVGFFSLYSKITFKGTTTISFENNTAGKGGGGLYCGRSNIIFKGNCTITLTNNRALNGGAILANDYSNVTVREKSKLSFTGNEAIQNGGAGYFNYMCNYIIKENAMMTFDNNKAIDGGAMFVINNTKIIFKGNSIILFCDNSATEGGGATKIITSSIILKDNVTNTFTNNSAQYGAAIFLDSTAEIVNDSDINCLHFQNNFARVSGNSMYGDVSDLCNSTHLMNRMIGIITEFIATPPNELKFYDPAICIDNDNDTPCHSYYVRNIMLGSDIIIPACVLDYYNHSVESTRFLAHSDMSPKYFISGPKHILISYDVFKGISIIRNESLSKSTNFSMTVSLNTALYSNWKQISINLTIELSPCRPGFWQYPKTKKCKCYDGSNIVLCSDDFSTIKKGYWFGSINGKPTITFCPINYCNFTCCEASSGYYHLSKVRDNQCRSHRFGTACGSCTDGYTLSFDSTECVNIKNCTAGHTVLVVLITVIYWIVMVAIIFAMMHYNVGIGYLYSITYYYGVVDILLNQNLQASRVLDLTVRLISSFSKMIPQFLGEFCLTTGMSGIDQQFIHYMHLTVIVILIIPCLLLANYKQAQVSKIISSRKMYLICLLLLLSYTTMVSTSLLLIRPLTFHEIDEVFTYLSPDIEYFHERHLVYGIVALLCAVTIVIVPPSLLTVEPFLNQKVDFTKIKPFLNQFQDCYKDRHRCFAGYYMICRLLLNIIVTVNSSNDFVTKYMFVTVSGSIYLIHSTVKPYNKELLNKFDSIILHLIFLTAVLPLLENYDSPLVITMAFVLVNLPWFAITCTLLLHKDNLRKITAFVICKCKSVYNKHRNNNEIGLAMQNVNATTQRDM